MLLSSTVKLIGVISLVSFPFHVATAHTTIAPKNTPAGYGERSELEGSSSVFHSFSIPHGCAGDGYPVPQAITAMSIVFPNGADAVAVDSASNESVQLSDHVEGNAIMSPRPVQDNRVFADMATKKGSVPEFNSHGLKSTDVSAFHFWNGSLNPDFVGLVPFRASFPSFKSESCVSKLTVRMAIANYCTFSQNKSNRADIWMGELTDKYDDESVVSTGFWPRLDVVRDLENNPLPASCGEGTTIEVQPSSDAIDALLPLNGYWPN